MGGIGFQELLVILVIVLLLFGAKRLPSLAAGMGGAVNEFKRALRGDAPTMNETQKPREADKVPVGSAERD
jgi:sec-independent protein translocase protein TatA